MAERRMFAKAVVGSDRFRELPPAAQALYLQLSMAADDEGFLRNARSTARAIGADAKALEELVNARFLLRFDSGVMLIRHWHVSNAIRADRRRGTACIAEREMVTLNRNGVYCLRTGAEASPAVSIKAAEQGQPADMGQRPTDTSFPNADSRHPSSPVSVPSTPHMVDSRQPNDNQMPKADNQFPSQVRLGKVRSGEVRSGKKEREGIRSISPLPFPVLLFTPRVQEDGAACRRQGLRAPPC